MIRTVHPFPARMAPEIALSRLAELRPCTVLDPMAGSGTVLRHAAQLGHYAIGFDMDPLAVLMSSVWTSRVDFAVLERMTKALERLVAQADGSEELNWIDGDQETLEFTNFWFAESQSKVLRKYAYGLSVLRGRRLNSDQNAALNILQLALSRIIVTKDAGASLARDVSHSRPHRVMLSSQFDVVMGFERSLRILKTLVGSYDAPNTVTINYGDARRLTSVENEEIDVVLTSPPYLNAIDYMRGHRLSLVWLGHRLKDLRRIRSSSIGAERAAEKGVSTEMFTPIVDYMCDAGALSSKDLGMVRRYSVDLYLLMSETARVLSRRGTAVFVVGNSCLKNQFIRNSNGVVAAGEMVGLRLTNQCERELPANKRYLPMPNSRTIDLGKRMRSETILTFERI